MSRSGGKPAAQAPSAQPSAFRTAVEQVSVPVLKRLARVPRIIPAALTFLVVIGGLLLGGVVGAALILLAVLLLGWWLFLWWPRLSGVERLMRLTVIVLGVGLAVVRLFPR